MIQSARAMIYSVLATILVTVVMAKNPFLGDCNKSIFGCCPDLEHEAMGRLKEGCGEYMCADMIDTKKCKMMRDQGDCMKGRYSDTDYKTASNMKRDCYRTCGFCKHSAPKKCLSSPFGCCWDGSVAKGPNKRLGCPRCRDSRVSRNYCRNHREECLTARGPRYRGFFRKYCKLSCDYCY